ncbi:MAG: transglutaminase family protein, partial [bacterium]|nr:transglutaminase family protein [bacterium]
MAQHAPRFGSPNVLVEGALAISMLLDPQVKPASVIFELNRMALHVRDLVPRPNALARISHLNEYFYEELGFCPSTKDDLRPEHHSLSKVLRARQGSPTLLALIYTEVLRQLDIKAWGV